MQKFLINLKCFPIVVIWLLSPPFVLTNALNITFYKEIIVLFSIGLFYLNIFKYGFKNNDYISYLLITGIIYSIFNIFIHYDNNINLDFSYFNIAMQFFVTLNTYLYAINRYGMMNLIKLYLYIMSFISILVIPSFFLIFLGFLAPIAIFSNPDGRDSYNFIAQFTNTINYINDNNFIRSAGYFDEPGTLAFLLTFALLLNFFTYRSNKLSGLFIFAGVLTQSLAFFISISIYFLFISQISCLKKLTAMLVSIFTISVIILTKSDSPIIYQIYLQTIGRFELLDSDSVGLISGDNRSSLLMIALEMLQNNFYFGSGFLPANTATNIGGFQSTLEIGHPLVFHGVIGFIIYFLIPLNFFYISIKSKQKIVLFSALIIFLNFIQRPSFFGSGLYGILVIMMIFAVKNFKYK